MAVQTFLSSLKTPAVVVVHGSRRKGRRRSSAVPSPTTVVLPPDQQLLGAYYIEPASGGGADVPGMSFATMLHALKSLVVFKVLAGFYFVSLFVQVLYYSQIQQQQHEMGTMWPSLRSYYYSSQQPPERMPLESIGAITQDLSIRITDGNTLTSDRTLSIGGHEPEQQQRLRGRHEHDGESRSGGTANDLSFGLERIKTDDWHHLENYEAPSTDRELPALVELPRNSLPQESAVVINDRRPVFFLHIRSSAGTSLCYAARANGMKTPSHQCHPDPVESSSDAAAPAQPSTEAERTSSYNFVSQPDFLPDVMDKERYRYVTMLRNSQDRYRSHWKSVVFRNPDEFSFPEWWERLPDNWNVRMICGDRCRHVPKFQITQELFQYAMDRLDQFDHVLLAEEFNATFATFAQQVGWTQMPVPASPLVHSTSTQTHHLPYAPFKWGWDKHMSVLDDALYEHAVAKVRGNTNHQLTDSNVEAMNEYFARGPARRCVTPCCHDHCSPTE